MSGRRTVSSGSVNEQRFGYSRAVVDGDWVFVSGLTGFEPRSGEISDSAVDQTHQAIRNIQATLAQAGALLADVVRVRLYITDAGDAEDVLLAMGQHFGKVRPAATAVVCQLIDYRMKVEIEVTAKRRPPGQGGTSGEWWR